MPKLSFIKEILGLYPYRLRIKQALIAILGSEDVPRSKAGLSALKQFYFYYGPKMWLGYSIRKRQVILSNLFNHTQTSFTAGWSVKKTQVLDFRDRSLTYDSHNGTDFAIVPGTHILTAAPGQIVGIISEFNRGGLKIFIDHGEGLMTSYAHLARALVKVGDRVHRGQEIALSGYSGLDAVLTFPWGLPHIHFNVWLNTFPIDPFASHNQEISMWRQDNRPQPQTEDSQEHAMVSQYDEVQLHNAIESCKTESVKTQLQAISSTYLKGAALIATRNYYPTRFTHHQTIYTQTYKRREILDLPFRPQDFDGVLFLDEI
jgi:murein DD-endopeptidase MepM/ murein hydrolase activator NlpD